MAQKAKQNHYSEVFRRKKVEEEYWEQAAINQHYYASIILNLKVLN